MARYITVSSIGPTPSFPVIEKDNPDNLVNDMIDYWRRRMERVLPSRPDLIVLPEMCDTYLNTPAEIETSLRDAMGNRMWNVLREIAVRHHCYIVYPTVRFCEDKSWRNTAMIIDRHGNLAGQYHKNHLTIPEMQKGILCGTEAPLIECDFGTVGMVICFDLNFSELRLHYQKQRPDLLIFPSMYHGGLMQSYWAYFCQSHFVGCMAFENLPNEIYSPLGHLLATNTNYDANVTARINLDCEVVHWDYHQEKMFLLKEKYGDEVDIFDPGKLAAFLISSRSETVTAREMLREFEMETLHDYLHRSLEQQRNQAHCATIG